MQPPNPPKNPNDNSFSFSIDAPAHDIILSMGQQINDLSLSLSKISLKNQELSSELKKQKQKLCPQGHPMRYIFTELTETSAYRVCDNCQAKVDEESSVYWSCLRCDYDLCRKCGGFKRTVCVYSHPLEYVQQYKTNTIKCDICLQPNLKSGWHCDCDFDICEKCYDGY